MFDLLPSYLTRALPEYLRKRKVTPLCGFFVAFPIFYVVSFVVLFLSKSQNDRVLAFEGALCVGLLGSVITAISLFCSERESKKLEGQKTLDGGDSTLEKD